MPSMMLPGDTRKDPKQELDAELQAFLEAFALMQWPEQVLSKIA